MEIHLFRDVAIKALPKTLATAVLVSCRGLKTKVENYSQRLEAKKKEDGASATVG